MNEDRSENQYKRVAEDKFDVSAWGIRHSQCIYLLITLTIAYSMRACMGVALVAMMMRNENSSNETHANTTMEELNSTIALNGTARNGSENIEDDFEVHGFFNALLLSPPYPTFNWPKKAQDFVMSSFFLGYMTLQIPSGQLAHKFGARYLLVGAMLTNSVISLLFPVASYYGGWTFAVVCRIFQGLTQAVLFPSIHTILGKWSPLEERGRMSGVINGGQAIGPVLGLPIIGYMCASPLGWPGVFRFYGVLSGLIAIVLWFFLSDSPAKHKSISLGERNYIEEALNQTGPKKKLPVPWRKILTNSGMIAIVAAHIGHSWGVIFMLTEGASVYDKIMGVNLNANGILSALPFLVMWLANFFYSWFYDMLIVKKYLNVTQTRKLANNVGFIPASVGFVALAYAPRNIYVVETLLILICIFKVSCNIGFHVNHVDISPNYAGTMMSVSNFMSNLVGAQAPIITGAIVTDATDEKLWRIVLLITSGFFFFTNLLYVTLGTGELAEWNDPPQYEKVALTENGNTKIRNKEDEYS